MAEVARRIEVFSAGCAACREAIELTERLAAERSLAVDVLDMHQDEVARRAKEMGIRTVPAVVVTTSRLAACCEHGGPEKAEVRAAIEA